MNQELKRGLSSQIQTVLAELYKNDIRREDTYHISQLAREMSVVQSRVSEICHLLDKNGLLDKVRDEDNGRIKYLELTEEGREFGKHFAAVQNQIRDLER